MKIFFKSINQSFLKSSRDINLKSLEFNPNFKYNMGIDGSTTSFGLSWYTQDKSEIYLLILMRSTYEDASSFMEEAFPFITQLFRQVKFNVVTYERTPDSFDDNSLMVKTMKKTEKSISLFLKQSRYIEIEDRNLIFDIFPNSWKSYLVNKSDMNRGKVNKRENACSILKYLGLDLSFWLKELDALKGHMYDCIEALGIGLYGSDFIYQEPFVRVYRNFTRQHPLYLLSKIIMRDGIELLFKELISIFHGVSLTLYTTNPYHSCFENLYGLDNDNKIGLLLTDTDDPLKIYLEHISGLSSSNSDDVLVQFTLRTNERTSSLLGSLSEIGYSILDI